MYGDSHLDSPPVETMLPSPETILRFFFPVPVPLPPSFVSQDLSFFRPSRRVRGGQIKEKQLSSKNGGRLRRRGELRRWRRPRSLRGGVEEEAGPVLAAVAKSMETKSQESSLGYPNSQASDISQLISQASDTSLLISQASFDGDEDEASLFTNSYIIDNADSQGNPASTGISKEQSDDDDDLEETTNPANAKIRRVLSNRESARRSRKRKQTHLDDLESQVSSLTAENASLLKRLADMTQKYKDATLDNRHLIAEVEMMRRKV